MELDASLLFITVEKDQQQSETHAHEWRRGTVTAELLVNLKTIEAPS